MKLIFHNKVVVPNKIKIRIYSKINKTVESDIFLYSTKVIFFIWLYLCHAFLLYLYKNSIKIHIVQLLYGKGVEMTGTTVQRSPIWQLLHEYIKKKKLKLYLLVKKQENCLIYWRQKTGYEEVLFRLISFVLFMIYRYLSNHIVMVDE